MQRIFAFFISSGSLSILSRYVSLLSTKHEWSVCDPILRFHLFLGLILSWCPRFYRKCVDLIRAQFLGEKLVHHLMAFQQRNTFKLCTNYFQIHLEASFATLPNDLTFDMLGLELVLALYETDGNEWSEVSLAESN